MMKSQYNIEADEYLHIFFEEDRYLEERAQFHDSMEFIFMTSGKAIAHIEDKCEEIVPGDIFFVDSYSTHFYEMIGQISAIVLVLSREHTERFRQLYSDYTLSPFLKNKEKNIAIIDFVKKWMEKENRTTLYNRGCTDILFSLLIEAYPLIKKQDFKGDTVLKDLLMFIHLHYQESITLNSIAHDLGYISGGSLGSEGGSTAFSSSNEMRTTLKDTLFIHCTIIDEGNNAATLTIEFTNLATGATFSATRNVTFSGFTGNPQSWGLDATNAYRNKFGISNPVRCAVTLRSVF